MSNIQFSYPQITSVLSGKTMDIKSGGGSFFELTYTKSGSVIYRYFTPTKLSFNNDSMIIEHSGTNGTKMTAKFKISQSASAKTGITPTDIYINRLIGDGLEGGKTINGKVVSVNTKDDKNYTIDLTNIVTIPIKTLDKSYSDGGVFPTITATSPYKITLTSNTFITDELVCDEGTDNSTDAATKTYEAKIAGNVGLSFGLGFLVLTAVVALITQKQGVLQFTGPVSLFNMEGPVDTVVGDKSDNKTLWRKGYVGFYTVAFLLSFSCFMGYGGVLSSGSGSTDDLTGLLWTAIVSFLIFVFMVGYKMVVLTKPAVVAAPPAAAP
jgi:hypothetical protein